MKRTQLMVSVTTGKKKSIFSMEESKFKISTMRTVILCDLIMDKQVEVLWNI